MEITDELTGLQQTFDAAELADDRSTLAELMAEDFLSIGPRGFVLDKRHWIDRHDHFRYVALDVSDVDVRVYGDAAIVRSVQQNVGRHDDQDTSYTVRVGQVWVREDAVWRLAGIQFSPLPQDS